MRFYEHLPRSNATRSKFMRVGGQSPEICPMSIPAVRRRIEFDPETWHALHQYSLETGRALNELATEAFRDLLRKHRRPVTLQEALRESVRRQPANDQPSATVHRLRVRRP